MLAASRKPKNKSTKEEQGTAFSGNRINGNSQEKGDKRTIHNITRSEEKRDLNGNEPTYSRKRMTGGQREIRKIAQKQ